MSVRGVLSVCFRTIRCILINSHVDVASEAYGDAVQYFERELTDDEQKKEWIRGHDSWDHVLEVVEQAGEK